MIKSSTITYASWRSMKSRCHSKGHSQYCRYKDVVIDPKWLKFEGFYEDMGDRPNRDHVLDRIDSKGGYNKSNCRWITKAENTRLATFKHGLSKDNSYRRLQYYKKNNKIIPNYKKELIKDIF